MNYPFALTSQDLTVLQAIGKRDFEIGYLSDPVVARLNGLRLIRPKGDVLCLTFLAEELLGRHTPKWQATPHSPAAEQAIPQH